MMAMLLSITPGTVIETEAKTMAEAETEETGANSHECTGVYAYECQTDNLKKSFLTLDGTTVTTEAQGKPKLLVFFDVGSHLDGVDEWDEASVNVIKAICKRRDEYSNVDIIAANTGLGNAGLSIFKDTYGDDSITFVYGSGLDVYGVLNSYAGHVHTYTRHNRFRDPFLVFINKNNQICYVSSDIDDEDTIVANIKKYCNATSNENNDSNDGNSGSSSENGDDNNSSSSSGVIEGSGSTDEENISSYGTRTIHANPVTFNTIQLSWDTVPGAKSYEIFYSTSPNSGYKRLTATKKNFYKFSKGKCGVTYYFQMRVCTKGAKSEFGPVSYSETSLTGSPTLQLKKTTYNSITLKWNKVPGAKKYEIFYTDTIGGKWESLGIKGGTSFTHKKLVTGATYYYQIRPVRDSFYGDWSNGISASTTFDNVTKLKVKAASADRMKLSWRKVKGATQYVILRSDKIDGTYEIVGRSARTSYIDTGLQGGTTYFYKVYAVSGSYRTQETKPVGQMTKISKIK